MRRRSGFLALAGLPFGWLVVFFVLPLAIVVRLSLSESALAQPPYRPVWPGRLDPADWLTFLRGLGPDNFATLLDDPLYLRAGLTSLGLALAATALLLLIGFPVALAMARADRRWRPVLVTLVVVPFWTSFLIRTYAWIAILKPDGWLSAALRALGLGDGIRLLDTPAAVLVGMVYGYLPFMILPIYASLERLDTALLDAAAGLGASPGRVFRRVTLPLARPGLAAGSLLCFIPAVGEFVIPDLLGGSDTLTIGRTLWTEFFLNRDWPLASAVAVVLLAVLVIPIVWFRDAEARRLEQAG